MRERALYAVTFGLSAVAAGLVAFAAWELLPPEPAPQVIAATAHAPRATEPRRHALAPEDAEERATVTLADRGDEVSKRGADEPRHEGRDEQAVATAPVAPAAIGGPFVAPDHAAMAAPASERSPVLTPEASLPPANASHTAEHMRIPAPEAQAASAPDRQAGDATAQMAREAAPPPATERQPRLSEATDSKISPAVRKPARQAAAKKRRAMKSHARRAHARKMLGRRSVRVWRAEPPEQFYVYDQMITPGPRIIVIEPE